MAHAGSDCGKNGEVVARPEPGHARAVCSVRQAKSDGRREGVIDGSLRRVFSLFRRAGIWIHRSGIGAIAAPDSARWTSDLHTVGSTLHAVGVWWDRSFA